MTLKSLSDRAGKCKNYTDFADETEGIMTWISVEDRLPEVMGEYLRFVSRSHPKVPSGVMIVPWLVGSNKQRIGWAYVLREVGSEILLADAQAQVVCFSCGDKGMLPLVAAYHSRSVEVFTV